MPDGLDRIVLQKSSVIFSILSKLLKRMLFFLISSSFRNTVVNFNLLMRQKIYGKYNEANPLRNNYVG